MLPNFLIIGAMKSGTTTLYHLLKSHPDIFMAENKEPQYFSDDIKFNKGLRWYESLFARHGNERLVGEASTNYAKYPAFKNVPERIKRTLNDAKIIYVLRDPVDRIYSHFVHNYYMGREENDFESVVNKSEHYINVSKYYYQIQQYLEYFDRDHIKVILLDDLNDHPAETMADIYRFLGVDDKFTPAIMGERRHSTESKKGQSGFLMSMLRKVPFYHSISNNIPDSIKGILNTILRKKVAPPVKPDASIRRAIQKKLEQDILSLQDYLGRDLSHWLK